MNLDSQVPSGSDTGRNTSLTAGNPQSATAVTTGNRVPYSPKNPRRKGYKKIPWTNEIIDRGKLLLVNIHHGSDPVQTMILDKADADKIRYPVRLDKDGHALNRGSPAVPVAHTVLDFKYNPDVDAVVDHKNRIPLDNRRRNLRVITVRGNNLNQSARTSNSTGIRGLNRDVYVDKNGQVRYEAYEAIIVDPNSPLVGPAHKAKQHRKKFYFGKNGVPEGEARRSAERWLKSMSIKFDRENLSSMECGSTTIPGAGVGSSDPK